MTRRYTRPPQPDLMSPEEGRLYVDAFLETIDRMIAGEFLPAWVTDPQPDDIEAAQAFLADPPAAAKPLVDALVASRAGDHHDDTTPDH